MLEQPPSKTSSKTKRLHILTENEIEDLYAQPKLTEDEKLWMFELNNNEQQILSTNFSIASMIDAIIQLGYFKCKQQFFYFDLHEVSEDVDYIMQRYFSSTKLDKPKIGRAVKLNNQKWVLRMTGYMLFNQKKHATMLLNKAKKICFLSVSPVFIFQELLVEVTQKKITRPGYSTLQKIISGTLVGEQERISLIFKKRLPALEKTQLLSMLENENAFYPVTLLKQQPKNFKATSIRQEIEYYTQYQHLYKIAKRLLPLLGIAKKGIEYYASLVEDYPVQDLSRMDKDQACLWLICFIHHRCKRMLDNLATMFIYSALPVSMYRLGISYV